MSSEQSQAQQRNDSLRCLLLRLQKEKNAGWLFKYISARGAMHKLYEDIHTKLHLDPSVRLDKVHLFR